MTKKERDWKKFIRDDIPFEEFMKLFIECINQYYILRHTIKDAELREKLDKYLEGAVDD